MNQQRVVGIISVYAVLQENDGRSKQARIFDRVGVKILLRLESVYISKQL